jgi:hypothetical protein
MLVRVAPETEALLDGASLGLIVLRTRHPIPACQRARIMRPIVIVLGPDIRQADAALLWHEAASMNAGVIELSWMRPSAAAEQLRRHVLQDRRARS